MTLTLVELNALARLVQDGVPLCPRPFDEIGRRLALPPADVLETLSRWSSDGRLREISAVLEGSLLGYESALCAASVPERELQRVVEVVNAHPTVSHNYLREHAYNLWFTIAAPRAMGLHETLARLAARAGVPFFPARRTRTYKLGVNFDLLTHQNSTKPQEDLPTPHTEMSAQVPLEPSAREQRVFRALQTPLPLVDRPFAVLAGRAECGEEELLAFTNRHLGRAIRRYVATLKQRKIGVRGNAMVVFDVPDDELDEAGRRLAQAPEVSHCYARERLPGFPYSLYSVVHGPDDRTCQDIVSRLAQVVDAEQYKVLTTVRELKKCRLRYFLPELESWWEESRMELVT